MLNKEKAVVGFYISGHPLDDYKLELDHFVRMTFDLEDLTLHNRDIYIGGMVTNVENRFTKTGKPFKHLRLRIIMTALPSFVWRRLPKV